MLSHDNIVWSGTILAHSYSATEVYNVILTPSFCNNDMLQTETLTSVYIANRMKDTLAICH